MADANKPVEGNNVEQIREILFGGPMRDYERRFHEFDQRLETEMARLRDAQDKRLAQMERRMDEQFDKLGKLLRQEIEDRNGAVGDLESRLQQSARLMRSEIGKSMDALGEELARSDERLRGAIAELDAGAAARHRDTESALVRSQSELRADRVGREDLAAMLTELALRLRGDFDLPSR